MDALETNIQKRAEVYENISNKFSFLLNFDLKDNKLTENVKVLVNNYPDDIDENLCEEIKHFHLYIKKKLF